MRIKRNLLLIDIHTIASHAFFIFPVAIPYYIDQIGIGFNEFLIGEAAFAVAMVLLEVPSGWLSDVWQRKHTLALGTLILLLGFLCLVIAKSFAVAMLSQILLGIGMSLMSGTNTAILYDSLLSVNRTKEYQKREGRRGAFSYYAMAISSILGGLLYVAQPQLPIIVTMLFLLVSLITLCMLDEPSRQKKTPEHHPVKDMLFTIKYALHGHAEIAFIIFFSAALLSCAKVISWTQQPYYIALDISKIWFGFLMAAGLAVAGASSHLSHLLEGRLSINKTFFLFWILALIVCMGAGITVTWVGVVLLMFAGACIFGVIQPRVNEVINSQIDSSRRATILSTQNLMVSLLFIPLSVAMGSLSDNFGVQGVFAGLIIWLCVAGIFLGMLFLRKGPKLFPQ